VAPAPDVAGLVDLVEIGRGGFGVVYRALEQDLDRPVAVKVMFGQLNEASRRRFERERRAMGKISGHPHVVTVYRTGMTDSGQPFIVMELMGGGSMRDRVRADGPVPWDEAAGIGMDIASALDEAHRAGIRHRDIKPGNLLVSTHGVVKLADFGIALISGGPETQSSVVTASLAHAAPEVLAGQRPDERSDIYSLGSTLYELLRGHPAFVRDGEESIVPLLARIARDGVPSLADAGVPPAICEIIEQAMAKDPANRPQSAVELRDALRRARTAGLAAQDMAQRTTLLGPDALAPPPVPLPIAPPGGVQTATRDPAASAPTRYPPAPAGPTMPPGYERPPGSGRGRSTNILAGVIAIGAVVAALAVIGWLAERQPSDETGASEAPTDPLTAGESSELLGPAESGLSGTTGIADYDEYLTLTDNDGVISVDVPAAWSDVEVASREIVAAPLLSGFYYSYDGSGGAVSVVSPPGGGPDEVLDSGQESNCVDTQRSDYDDGVFTGRYDTWTGCGPEQTTTVVHLALQPVDGSDFVVRASIQMTEERDVLVAERFLNSIVVNPSAL
jgi:hypothetical protein